MHTLVHPVQSHDGLTYACELISRWSDVYMRINLAMGKRVHVLQSHDGVTYTCVS
jgi:hypothetical protein